MMLEFEDSFSLFKYNNYMWLLVDCKTLKMYVLLTKHEVKMAGYWPSSPFASQSIKTQKENDDNTQPS